MRRNILSKSPYSWVVLFLLFISMLTSCDPIFPYKRENVPMDRILIPPTERTDYVGVNLEDSIAVFYSFRPYEFRGLALVYDCVFRSYWCKYKGKPWLLVEASTGLLYPESRSASVSIHLQVSPKDWIVHEASVFFHDFPRMCDDVVPAVFEELENRYGVYDPYRISWAAREDVKVDIYKDKSSKECVKGVITGTFTQWSNFKVSYGVETQGYYEPYNDFYPETISGIDSKKHLYYIPVDKPLKFQLSFTTIKALTDRSDGDLFPNKAEKKHDPLKVKDFPFIKGLKSKDIEAIKKYEADLGLRTTNDESITETNAQFTTIMEKINETNFYSVDYILEPRKGPAYLNCVIVNVANDKELETSEALKAWLTTNGVTNIRVEDGWLKGDNAEGGIVQILFHKGAYLWQATAEPLSSTQSRRIANYGLKMLQQVQDSRDELCSPATIIR